MRAVLRYEEPTITLIHRMKYDGYFALADPLSRLLAGGWPEWTTPPEIIVPIPLHSRRRRHRGFNQSELLARPLAGLKGIALNCVALQRTRDTAPQVGLGPQERESNVYGAFKAEPQHVRDRHVLMIDDVLTTGATMSAAAEALLAAGASRVSAYCLARVS
jgi:ComF family protein